MTPSLLGGRGRSEGREGYEPSISRWRRGKDRRAMDTKRLRQLSAVAYRMLGSLAEALLA